MSTWQIILIPIGLIVVGLVRQVLILRKKHTRLGLAMEFLERFINWFNSKGEEHESYNWMTEQSDTVQMMLGGSGVIAFSDPLRGIRANNWPIILNALPEINHAFSDRDYGRLEPMSRRNLQLAQYVENCLRRFIGSTEEQLHRERSRLFNPLVLFCGGVAWLMELPLFILSETKIITASRRAIIVNGRLFSMVSGIVALAALAGTIITIVTGWERFVQIVTGWVK
jgi:hypothetical protein